MPVRDAEGVVAGAVAAILEQGYPGELEVVIALGPSRDRTATVLEGLAADPRVRVVANPTGGTAAGLNAAEIQELNDLIKRIQELGVTVILVEHHVDLVMRISDQVIVLDRGRIVERGTHPELLAKRGLYSNLYRQFVRLGLGGAHPPGAT